MSSPGANGNDTFGVFVTDEVLTIAEVGFNWTVVASVLAAISGVLMFTTDVQHGTLAPAIAARPWRVDIALAKAAVATLVGVAFGTLGVVENLLLVFIPAQIVRCLPFFAGNHLLDLDSDIDSPEAIAVALSRIQNAAVFAGYELVSLAVGIVMLRRRDVD